MRAHRCPKPGWLMRRLLRVAIGDRVECPCGRMWRWQYIEGDLRRGAEWAPYA